MEGGCHTVYTDNHYNSDLFSVICEEFSYSVLLTCLNMKHMHCHTPLIHIEYWDRQKQNRCYGDISLVIYNGFCNRHRRWSASEWVGSKSSCWTL